MNNSAKATYSAFAAVPRTITHLYQNDSFFLASLLSCVYCLNYTSLLTVALSSRVCFEEAYTTCPEGKLWPGSSESRVDAGLPFYSIKYTE